MKFLKLLTTVILFIFISIYILLFTSFGNSLLKPIAESEISKILQTNILFKNFSLNPNRVDVKLISQDGSIVKIDGKIDLFAQSLDLLYSIKINNLSIIENLIGKELKGSFETEGLIKGDRYLININGKSDIANSDTSYNIELKNLEPQLLKLSAKHLEIDRLLYILNQPIYANGVADIKADITSFDFGNLDGKITAKVKNSTLNPEPIKSRFKILIPSDIKVKAEVESKLKGTKVVSSLFLTSSINKILSKNIIYDLKRESLKADYKIEIPDLDKLYFLTKKHLRGEITVTGNIEIAEDFIQTTAHANTLGGVVDLLLKNYDVNIDIKNIQTIALTDMLLYPHIFDSRANVKINYNLATKKGTLNLDSFNGEFLPNEMSFLIKKYTNFDITKEIYEHTILQSKIDNKLLNSNLHMKSKFTEISSKNAIIDLENETINTKLDIKIKDYIVPIYLEGKLQKPFVKLEADKLIKKRVIKEIENRLPEKIKESPLKDLIKSLFNRF